MGSISFIGGGGAKQPVSLPNVCLISYEIALAVGVIVLSFFMFVKHFIILEIIDIAKFLKSLKFQKWLRLLEHSIAFLMILRSRVGWSYCLVSC